MSLELLYHGGECCGVRHLFNFYQNFPTHSEVTKIKMLLGEEVVEDCFGEEFEEEVVIRDFCTEVCLTKDQATSPHPKNMFQAKESDKPYIGRTWNDVLTEDFGFDMVFKFKNPNTKNIIFVYLLSDSKV